MAVLLAAGAASVVFSCNPALGEVSPGRPVLAARAIPEPITLDGWLNEPAWREIPAASGFVQREPKVGEPATEPTEVRIAYTPATLYIGIRALDSDPRAVVAREMTPDADIVTDDSVSIVIDTFLDRRNGYFFATNANGVRTDALISDEGDGFDVEWDGLWQVEARRTEEGWSAEMAIPFSTLRFAPGSGEWGLNVRRLVRRKGEETYWAPLPLEADIARMSLAGRLSGIDGITPGLNLRVKPFAVASGRESLAAHEEAAPIGAEDGFETGQETGLDLKWGVGRGMSLDLTVNTDFAESEADEQQVNLSRFSLFLPEKREFFLENAGIFDFGPRTPFGQTLFRPFFSRRIGIGADGGSVPMEWGARLSGRSGPWSLGFMDVQTGPRGDGESENWGVVRAKRRMGDRATLGVLSTRHDSPEGTNLLYGMDGDYQPTSRLKLRSFWAMSDDPSRGGDAAGGAGAVYRGPRWRWSLDALEIGDDFNPEMGFLLRRGVRRYAGSATWLPRPDIPGVRYLFFESRNQVYTDLSGEVESIYSELDFFALRTKSDDAFGFFAVHNFERLEEPFEIRPGVVIPAGEHAFEQAGAWFETNVSRPVSVEAWVQQGDFFDGDRFASGVTLRLRPGRHFRSETIWDHNDVRLSGGSFSTNLFRQRLQVALTPDLSTAALVQYSDAAELLAVNLRLGWTYRPGADLFLVLNETWDAPSLGGRRERDRQAILKMTYLFAM
ncbi:MAG TPA: DUF5916 domain-containing protein [Thermoanaerobaculia bacterium]